MQILTTDHMKAMLNVVRYLKSAPTHGILMAKSLVAQLTTFCDSDWASCLIPRRSTIGYCIMLDDSQISWKSKK